MKEPFRTSTGLPVFILKGSLEGGKMINNTFGREETFEGGVDFFVSLSMM